MLADYPTINPTQVDYCCCWHGMHLGSLLATKTKTTCRKANSQSWRKINKSRDSYSCLLISLRNDHVDNSIDLILPPIGIQSKYHNIAASLRIHQPMIVCCRTVETHIAINYTPQPPILWCLIKELILMVNEPFFVTIFDLPSYKLPVVPSTTVPI